MYVVVLTQSLALAGNSDAIPVTIDSISNKLLLVLIVSHLFISYEN